MSVTRLGGIDASDLAVGRRYEAKASVTIAPATAVPTIATITINVLNLEFISDRNPLTDSVKSLRRVSTCS